MVRILIVEARFYEDVSDHLLEGVVTVLDKAGVMYDCVQVPGALEIPAAIQFASRSGLYDGYIALGCVIRGETYHFEVVSNESARGLMDLSVRDSLAIANGILTCENKEQAMVRADKTQKNKGGGFAEAVLTMMALKKGMLKRGMDQ